MPDEYSNALEIVGPNERLGYNVGENGFIYPGDLLVSSSKPGYAMKAPKDVKPGTVIGKSLDKQDEEEGIVLIIVMLC